uniref:Uncharacterized protein n=1 Tax=Solanum lycopersicum TaxID=4081 RepID=A0A3Q7I1P5_SOLLC
MTKNKNDMHLLIHIFNGCKRDEAVTVDCPYMNIWCFDEQKDRVTLYCSQKVVLLDLERPSLIRLRHVLLIKISVASTCTFDCTRNGRRVVGKTVLCMLSKNYLFHPQGTVFQLHCLSKRVVGWRSSKMIADYATASFKLTSTKKISWLSGEQLSYGEGNCYYQGGPSPVIPPPTYVAPLPRKNRGFLKGLSYPLRINIHIDGVIHVLRLRHSVFLGDAVLKTSGRLVVSITKEKGNPINRPIDPSFKLDKDPDGQPIVTLSTTEAEIVPATTCTSQAIWLRKLLEEVNCKQGYETPIYSTIAQPSNCPKIWSFTGEANT